MNIFILDKDPKIAAKYACDKHVVKMILESAQLLCSPYPNGYAPYKRTHYNHPCSIWVRQSLRNYDWLIEHALSLCKEYSLRYKKEHASFKVINWCDLHKKELGLPNIELTNFVMAIPDQYKVQDPVESYRKYYVADKAKFATWKNPSSKPSWFVVTGEA